MTAESDAFSGLLLEEAKRFHELAVADEDGREAHLHAALLIGFSALEAHVNGVADELANRYDSDLLEQSLLTEHAVELDDGAWKLGKTKYFRLEDRLSYLFQKYGGTPVADFAWWSEFKSGIDKRNSVVHPRSEVTVDSADVGRYLTAIVEALNALYLAVFRKGHPSYGRGLGSSLTF